MFFYEEEFLRNSFFREAKNFLHDDFEDDILDSDNSISFDFMENIDVEGKSFDLLKYLHGFCDEFAIYLSEEFQYDICFWTEYDYEINKMVLVHAFNKIKYNNKEYYVDIRGFTKDFEDILIGFEDYIVNDNLNIKTFSNLTDAKLFLRNILELDNYIINNKNEIRQIMGYFKSVYVFK